MTLGRLYHTIVLVSELVCCLQSDTQHCWLDKPLILCENKFKPFYTELSQCLKQGVSTWELHLCLENSTHNLFPQKKQSNIYYWEQSQPI